MFSSEAKSQILIVQLCGVKDLQQVLNEVMPFTIRVYRLYVTNRTLFEFEDFKTLHLGIEEAIKMVGLNNYINVVIAEESPKNTSLF
jgi:hypothetical protein